MKIAMPMGGERHRALAMLADAGWRGQPHALIGIEVGRAPL
jgi:hypothetical protein